MLNKIWFWLLLIGIVYTLGKSIYVEAVAPGQDAGELAAVEHDMSPGAGLMESGKALTQASLDAAELSVQLCLTLAGVMILWLGMLQIAKDAGMVDSLAYALRPVMRWLFPDVPDGHPAQGAMLMNISANVLGLDNAATPFGIKAMHELQELNPRKDVASDAMATFLALNTSSVTLMPISVIALRAAAGSESPAAPFLGILVATTASTAAAVIAVRWLSKWRRFSLDAALVEEDARETTGGDQ